MHEDARDGPAAGLGFDDVAPERAVDVFDQQDSGCISYRVVAHGRSWFVKTASTEPARASLASALRLHATVQHPTIVPPVRWFTTPDVVIVYPWIAGRVLNHATLAGSDRAGLDMFRRLGVVEIEAAIGDVLDAHLVVADRGFVAVDFYDGCLLYDFECRRMHLIDLDEYRPGPFTVEADRLPGSTSYMAPEELTHGSEIDQRTTVFNLGRMIHHLLDGPAGWRGTAAQLAIVTRATQVSPDCRNQNVGELTAEWTARHS